MEGEGSYETDWVSVPRAVHEAVGICRSLGVT